MWGVKERENYGWIVYFANTLSQWRSGVHVYVWKREKKKSVFFGWYEKFECYKNEEVIKNKCMKFRWTKENLSQII